MKKILFVCVENAGRSQMAEAFTSKYGKDKFIVSRARFYERNGKSLVQRKADSCFGSFIIWYFIFVFFYDWRAPQGY